MLQGNPHGSGAQPPVSGTVTASSSNGSSNSALDACGRCLPRVALEVVSHTSEDERIAIATFPQIVEKLRAVVNTSEIGKIARGLVQLGFTTEVGVQKAMRVYTPDAFVKELQTDLQWPKARAIILVAAILETMAQQPTSVNSEALMDGYQEIRRSLQDAVKGLRLNMPQAIRIDASSNRLASTVNDRRIPCMPGTDNLPLLLMEGLAPRLLDGGGNVVTVEQIRLIPVEEKARILNRLNEPRVLLGPSGGGKTRLLCEMLADDFGLLFVADRGETDGCHDFDDAMATVQDKVQDNQQQSTYQAEKDQSARDILESNLHLAKLHFLAVVLARLLLLECLLEHCEDPTEFSPAVWLWIQMYPDYMLLSALRFRDFFHSLWKQCLQLCSNKTFLRDRCDEVSRNIRALVSTRFGRDAQLTDDQLPCFVDEAQALLQCCEHQFPSSNPALRRSCFSAVTKSLATVCKGPLMAGTGIRMVHETTDIGTAAGGKYVADAQSVQFVRKGHLEPAACGEYISKYVSDIAEPDLTTICNILQGRPRFTERFVALCIMHGARKDVTDAMTIFNKYVELQVTGQPTPEPREMLAASKTSVFDLINNYHNRTSTSESARRKEEYKGEASETGGEATSVDLMKYFRWMVLRHALTGQPQIVRDKKQLELIEYGLANVEQQQGEVAASISEPIVTRAACYYFGLIGYQTC